MKSIKPGRGPSMMGAISSLFAALFGVFWSVMALKSGAPFFFGLFGLFFIGMALGQAWYNYHNATNKNRFSTFDIVDEEELDPLDPRRLEHPSAAKGGYCPYCGAPLQGDFRFCPDCGEKLP